MKLKKKTIKIFSIILLALILLFFALYKILDNGVTEYYSQYWVNESINSSKMENVFVTQLKSNTSKIYFNNYEISLDEVWIEKVSKINYQFLIIKQKEILNRYRLVITLKQKISDESLEIPFVLEDKGSGFVYTGYNSNEIYYDELSFEEINEDTIKVSLVKNLADERSNQLIFTKI
jgi:hypothetical protein